jgi:hypothetical protein
MPKPKTKIAVMDTTCTMVGTDWTWTTHAWRWRWCPGIGLNLRVVLPDGSESPQIYCKNLDLAVQHSWGFIAGLMHGRKEATDAVPGAQNAKDADMGRFE